MARLHPALSGTEVWLWMLTLFGGTTAVFASLVALRQTDLKQALAYTTLMALGTLTLLLGQSEPYAITAFATFLVVHSLYKAALFLAVGCVDHGTGTRDARVLGGLARAMPVTALGGRARGALDGRAAATPRLHRQGADVRRRDRRRSRPVARRRRAPRGQRADGRGRRDRRLPALLATAGRAAAARAPRGALGDARGARRAGAPRRGLRDRALAGRGAARGPHRRRRLGRRARAQGPAPLGRDQPAADPVARDLRAGPRALSRPCRPARRARPRGGARLRRGLGPAARRAARPRRLADGRAAGGRAADLPAHGLRRARGRARRDHDRARPRPARPLARRRGRAHAQALRRRGAAGRGHRRGGGDALAHRLGGGPGRGGHRRGARLHHVRRARRRHHPAPGRDADRRARRRRHAAPALSGAARRARMAPARRRPRARGGRSRRRDPARGARRSARSAPDRVLRDRRLDRGVRAQRRQRHPGGLPRARHLRGDRRGGRRGLRRLRAAANPHPARRRARPRRGPRRRAGRGRPRLRRGARPPPAAARRSRPWPPAEDGR